MSTPEKKSPLKPMPPVTTPITAAPNEGDKTPKTTPPPVAVDQDAAKTAKHDAKVQQKEAEAAKVAAAVTKRAEEDELQKHHRVIESHGYDHEVQNPHAAL